MSVMTIDFLDGEDDTIVELICALQYGISAAVEGEMVSPDFETAIRAWIRVKQKLLRPSHDRRIPQRDFLRESKWFEFWSTLRPEQEVRWTQAKAQTYFVVTGELVTTNPERQTYGHTGPWIELRRHTGKTFWSHIAQIRPLGWAKEKDRT